MLLYFFLRLTKLKLYMNMFLVTIAKKGKENKGALHYQLKYKKSKFKKCFYCVPTLLEDVITIKVYTIRRCGMTMRQLPTR